MEKIIIFIYNIFRRLLHKPLIECYTITINGKKMNMILRGKKELLIQPTFPCHRTSFKNSDKEADTLSAEAGGLYI
jgi:hypothetical protein